MSFAKYPEYKDSGVAWLGEVPGHWEVVRLKHHLRLLTEKTDRRTHPVALENIESWSGRFVPTETEFQGEGVAFECGDILFGKLRPYLAKALLATQAGEAVGDFHVMRPGSSIAPRFAQYSILNHGFIDIVDGSTFGSKMPRASWEFVGSMPMPTPPLPEQTAIATFLDRETAKIDALVAEQERLIALLQKKRQAVISHAVTKGLNPSAPMKDSGVQWLGEVPGHWEAKRLKFVASNIKAGPFGSALTKDMYVSSGYRVYGQEQVIPDDFSIGDYYIDEAKFSELSQYEIRPDDVLISCVGTFGKIAVVPADAEPGIINPRLLRLRTTEDVMPLFLAEVLRSTVTFEQFSALSRGGTMDVINIGTLSDIWIALPPKMEQLAILREITMQMTRFDALMTQARTAITLLQERRSALISAAVTGQIDLRAQAA
ncbi:MAG: restriction endonuclease subunit S [Proteobacteria bacterium]|nr:restriction endonuclease subunit S [Pseudomonadota bacterium]